MIESLERRQLLSAVFYDADSASINIRGTRGDDQISVERHNDRYLVLLNGQRRWFNAKPVQSIQVESFAGDDLIDLHHIALRTQSYTRDGNDTVLGGMGDDIAYGADGADRLVGGDGHDDLHGEGGRDRLIGESGNDTLTGDGGDDQMSGGGGDDYLIAASGVDRIDGGPGADSDVRYADRGDVISVESETYPNTGDSPDPSTHLSIRRTRTGVTSVVVTTTHYASGWKDHFEEMTREGDVFTATVFGEDLAGQDGGRFASIIVDQHVYRLGKLADGVYTFKAESPRQVLAAVTIKIANGTAVDAPTWIGPYSPPTIISLPG